MKRLLLKVASLFVVATMFYGCESLPSINNGGGGEDTSGDDLETLAAEREILIQFYRDTDGDNWTNNENWCSDKPIEEWYGITVYDGHYDENDNWVEGCSIDLDLENNNLRGSGSLAGMESLWWFDCSANFLTSLDVSGCPALMSLVCGDNLLNSLDVTNCRMLKKLDCINNRLTSWEVSGCKALKALFCSYNQLTYLDVSDCTALIDLECHNNRLTSLDISGCTELTTLLCNENLLTSLDISGCTKLRTLLCNNNLLSSLDISGCKELRGLSCFNNLLTQEITDIFEQLPSFLYDVRYSYQSEYVDGVGYVTTGYTDNGEGWWYPGEPEKGYHGK